MGLISAAFYDEMHKLAAVSVISTAVQAAHNPTLARYLPALRAKLRKAEVTGTPVLGNTRVKIPGGAQAAGFVHNVGN